jgi:hypothetical protein
VCRALRRRKTSASILLYVQGKNSTRDRWTDNCDVAGKCGSNTSTLSMFLKDRNSRTAWIPMQTDGTGKEYILETKKTWT